MRLLPVGLGRVLTRFVAKENAADGWRRVVGHHLAVPAGDGETPRVWLTFEGEESHRAVDAWPQIGEDDLRAITALLARPDLHWFNESTRALATAPREAESRSAAPPATTSVIVKGFEASWTPGEGGWLRLRFRRAASCGTEFAAADAARFTACVTAASAPDPIFDPRTGSIRSLPHGAPIGGLAFS